MFCVRHSLIVTKTTTLSVRQTISTINSKSLIVNKLNRTTLSLNKPMKLLQTNRLLSTTPDKKPSMIRMLREIVDNLPIVRFYRGRLVRLVRFVQVISLCFSLHFIGYQRGIAAHSQNPDQVERDVMTNILGKASKYEKTTVIYSRDHPSYKRVAVVARRILSTARNYCHEELNEARAHLRYSQTTSVSKEQLHKAKRRVTFWEEKSRLIEGEWKFIVSNSKSVNAFVTGILPRKIFVMEGLLDRVNPTEDELGMILAHELSHVLLGHTSAGDGSGALIAVQLALMSIVDPTGISSYLFDKLLDYLKNVIMARYSRQKEDEADDLGIRLASLACYDVNEGIKVFEKLQKLDTRTETSWEDSHPSSYERYKRLLEQAVYLRGSYETDCGLYRKLMREFGIYGPRYGSITRGSNTLITPVPVVAKE